MIIRHWNQHDLPAVAAAMLDLAQYTFYGHSGEYTTTIEEMTKWLIQMYADDRSTVILCEEQGEIVAMGGVSYGEMLYPPYLRVLHEWGLWGTSPVYVAKVWKVAKQWGKVRGALFSKRSILQDNRSHEHVKWEKLT